MHIIKLFFLITCAVYDTWAVAIRLFLSTSQFFYIIDLPIVAFHRWESIKHIIRLFFKAACHDILNPFKNHI